MYKWLFMYWILVWVVSVGLWLLGFKRLVKDKMIFEPQIVSMIF